MKFTMKASDRERVRDWLLDTTGVIAPPCIEVEVEFAPAPAPIHMSAQDVIALFHAQKPKLYWKIGRGIIKSLRQLKDDMGNHICNEPFIGETTLLGYKIELTAGSGIQFVTEMPTEEN